MKQFPVLIVFFTLIFSIPVTGGWLLPYIQPAAYDYSAYYDTILTNRLRSGMVKPAERLSAAWKYYAKTYIMPNGLVRHLRMAPDGVTVIGQNEAVSEGIGYGMLLALINNDQVNFNKIFEGANSNMWKKNGHNSYDCWEWANGGCTQTGAATDADLDIALALVFADKLQEKGFWSAYNNSGVTYKSRATEMIGSIKNTMTSGDVLLPGDSWGNDGSNNINPSYFSVAAMKVFSAYQTTHNFTSVINKCYSILESTSNYSKGQAPDWCTSSGGTTGKYYGMSIEAIRVPWRIGLDALWFNDSRAVKYCTNTKKTLTNYTTDAVFSQMIEYKPDGSPDTDNPSRQADNFERIACWSCAVLGSKDNSYSKPVFSNNIDGMITGGNTNDYFGPLESNKNFYYKQSLAMLSYATMYGLFPNILEDMKTAKPIEYTSVTSGLKPSVSSVKLPGSVALTALLDRADVWQLTLTGQTSNKKALFIDSGAQVAATFDGIGWFTVETVKAELSVRNIKPGTAASLLTTQFSITEAPSKPPVTPGCTLVVHDMENKKAVTNWNGNWFINNGAQSTTAPANASELVVAGVGNPGYAVKLGVVSKDYAGAGFSFKTSGSVNMSTFESVTFDYKTEGAVDSLTFILNTSNNNALGGHMQRTITKSAAWRTITIQLVNLLPPSSTPSAQLDLTKVEKMQWRASGVQTGTVYLDNIKVKLKSGQVPSDDIYALMLPVIRGISLKRASPSPFSIYQNSSGLIINAGDKLLPRLEIYTLTGERVFTCRFDMNTSYTNNNIIPITAGTFAPGQYIALLCGEPGSDLMMARRFIWE